MRFYWRSSQNPSVPSPALMEFWDFIHRRGNTGGTPGFLNWNVELNFLVIHYLEQRLTVSSQRSNQSDPEKMASHLQSKS